MQNTFLINIRGIRRGLIGILFLLLSLSMANFVYAQSDKPLTLVVPFPPGGSTDITARTIQTKLSERIGRPVVIENRPGAAVKLQRSM